MTSEEIEQYFYDLAIKAGYSKYEADLIAREIMDVTKNRSNERYYRVFHEIIDPLVKKTDGWQECD
jgi:hypothetical protein